ncbi:MAG: hypothetical protein ACOCP8_01025 [archaeon]
MIKHYRFNERYLCNQAVNPTPEKFAKTKEEVTCKNCIKSMHKYNIEPKTKETTQLQKLEKDYRQYQKAQAMSSGLTIIGIIGLLISFIVTQPILLLTLIFVSCFTIGFSIGMKLKTIKKVFSR